MPTKPEIHLKSDEMTVQQEVSIIIDYLMDNGIISRGHYTRVDDQADGATVATL